MPSVIHVMQHKSGISTACDAIAGLVQQMPNSQQRCQIRCQRTLPSIFLHLSTVNFLYQDVSRFTDLTQCGGSLTDAAMADFHVQLSQWDIGLDDEPKCSNFWSHVPCSGNTFVNAQRFVAVFI